MEVKKSFWKKYEVFIVVIITLAVVYLFVIFNQQFNYLLGNDLVLTLTPLQKSFNVHYGGVSAAEFDVVVDNFALCRAACSYEFNDRSRNEVIDKGDFELSRGEHFKKSYGLSVKRLGSGQDIYSFGVECRSIRSFMCLTEGEEKFRSSLVTLNYDLTETEKELKKILRQNVTELLELLSDADAKHQQLNQKFFELGSKVNILNLSKDKIDVNDAYDKVRISIENLRSLWHVENYISLNQLFNRSFFDNINDIISLIDNMDKQINNAADIHNGLLSELNILFHNLEELSAFGNVLKDDDISAEIGINIINFTNAASSLTENTFESYENAAENAAQIRKEQNSIIDRTRSPMTAAFFNSDYYLNFENDYLCSLQQNCKENATVSNVIKNAGKFIGNYPDSGAFRQNCNSLRALKQQYSDIRNQTMNIIEEINISFPADNEFLAAADNFKGNIARKINSSYFESWVKSGSEAAAEIVNIANATLPNNTTEFITIIYDSSVNISLYWLSKINLSDESLNILDECNKLGQPIKNITKFSFEPVIANITYNITSKIDTNLSDNPPICCIFNECKPCCNDESCRSDPKTFPVIFLHGHSVARGNSPEFSLDGFNKLQAKLQDDGYLNVGILLYSGGETAEKGEWGLSGKPVTVKVTYYYDVFRKEDKYAIVPTKSESIDTYALRFNDIVNVVREKTGKQKVNIVAFSMGGLVARKYLQIFGDESVDKLITIGSPHKGISGNVAEFCPVFGESKECIDVLQDSLFLNKLNDPSKQPSNVKVFNIIGRGCQRNGKDGDGIVSAESASLSGIADANESFINGTCAGSLYYFHTDLIDIEKFPETYNILSEILKK